MANAVITSVRPYMRVVANGRQGPILRATLVATPEIVADGHDGAFELADWPSAMAKRLTKSGFAITLHMREAVPGVMPPVTQWTPVKAHAVRLKQVPTERWAAVQTQWSDAFTRTATNPWAALADDIGLSLQAKKHKADLESPPKPVTKDKFDQDGAMIADAPKSDRQASIRGVIPVAQGAKAIEVETVRAARILAKIVKGPDCFDDREPRHDPTGDNKASQDPEALTQAHYDAYSAAFDANNQARIDSADRFQDVKSALDGSKTATVTATARPAPDLVPSCALVTDGNPDCVMTASHTYGTWLQRRSGYRWADNKPPTIPDHETLAKRTDSADRIRAIYYALQGDPVLSRLFCLAIDLEIQITALPPEWQHKAEICLHIATDFQDDAGRPPIAVTAAKLGADAFWPYSVFDNGLAPDTNGTYQKVDQPGLVEQRNGLWLLGTESDDTTLPRHDLVSLDIRRAMSGQSEPRDRGERHSSAGFTIMDHGRGNQVARDMALAAMHAPAVARSTSTTVTAQRDLVLLHADELTIGRRVDVAAIAPGAAICDVKGWRSLMQRLVTFHFGKGHEALAGVVATLLGQHPDTRVFVDENSFQTGARYMPLPEDIPASSNAPSDAPCEAIAEEAIFLWDGTPAAVLTSARDKVRAIDGDLPFTRVFRLPDGARHRELRPPPLRYGVPYAFALRSVFLGGGSPDPASAAAAHTRTAGTMVPPARGTRAAPRRFLRHDGIPAPTLLFAADSAFHLDPAMGYEELDKAIVRSAKTPPPPYAPPQPDPDEKPKGPQVPAADRARMAISRRVFVAPEAAHDKLVRHGMLDHGNAAQILRGGLRDVDYLPRKEAKPDDRLAGGFPMVVTRMLPSLDGVDATYKRDLYRDAQNDTTGSPIFRPGKNLADAPHGYLPDPAIADFCIRARILGCDRYLPGHRSVRLYPDGFAYPHALPLMVTVRCVPRLRPVPASTILDLGHDARPARLLSDGTVQNGWSGPGVKVQHLEFDLMENEDYGLEVACLPSTETFAKCFALPETIAMQLAAGRVKDSDAADRLKQLCGTPPVIAAAPDGPPMTGLGGLPAPPLAEIVRAAALVLDTIQTRWPIEEIAAVAKLRMCHATNCPVLPPLLGATDGEFNAIRIRRPRTTASQDDAVGATMLLLEGKIRIDLEQIDAFEVLVKTQATAGQRMDDKTRGRTLVSRRSGRWPRHTDPDGNLTQVARPTVLGMDVDDDGQVTLPRETVVLLRVENLPTHGACPTPPNSVFTATAGRYTTIDLGYLHAAAIDGRKVEFDVVQPPGAIRATTDPRKHVVKVIQKIAIADTRARDIELQIVALSRQAAAFETAPFYAGPNASVLHRRLPLRPEEQAIASASFSLPMPATERPSPCTARRPEPSFVMERRTLPNKDGVSYTVERSSLARLWLGRNRLSSGNGERVGIVLWPPFYFSAQTDANVDKNKVRFELRTIDISDFHDADLGAAGAFATRWGGDPIRADGSPQSGFLIPPSAFRDLDPATRKTNPHRPGIVPSIDMPVKTANNDEHLHVTLLTYEPLFDLDREEWYVDVDLMPIRAAEPFVRFGLVHYQQNAIPGQEVSYPVAVTLPLLPQRSAEVRVSGTVDITLKIGIEGLGMLDIADLDPKTNLAGDKDLASFIAEFDKLRKPTASAFVVYETIGADGTTFRTLLEPRDAESPGLPMAVSVKNDVLHWNVTTTVERSRIEPLGSGRIVVYVEETDRRMPASYSQEPILAREMFQKDRFTHSGPRFSARIPLKEIAIDAIVK